jgi:hypothetical protein
MAHVESITMSMREIDRLKTIQAVADGNLRAVTAARRLPLTRCQRGKRGPSRRNYVLRSSHAFRAKPADILQELSW